MSMINAPWLSQWIDGERRLAVDYQLPVSHKLVADDAKEHADGGHCAILFPALLDQANAANARVVI
jgi:hypothetical protein